MAQTSWLFLDDFGGRHRVGLYHGDQSGHLVIYADKRVVQIDFHVKETKTYTFFIEDELIEIHIWKEKDGKFTYEFVVNKEANTPRNQERKIVDRRNSLKIALIFGGGLLFMLAIFFGLKFWNDRQRQERWDEVGIHSRPSAEIEKRLFSDGKTTAAKVFLIPENGRRKAIYSFITPDGQQVDGKIAVADTGKITLPTGFWLSDGDEFQLTYLPTEPKTHQIRFDWPTSGQIEVYAKQAAAAEIAANPKKSPSEAACLVSLVLEEKGWKSLSEVVFQKNSPGENAEHNRETYLRLLREPKFSKLLSEKCWDAQ